MLHQTHSPPTPMSSITSTSGRQLPLTHVVQPLRPAKRTTPVAAALKGHNGTESSSSVSTSAQETSATQPQAASSPSKSLPGLISAPSKRYTIDLTDIIEGAPRIRVRTITDRQRNQLAELAVLNERLAGRDVTETRKRIEYLKGKRRTWEAIYQYLTRTEAAATLAAIEEANRKVEQALREGVWESKSVAEMRDELEELQVQVGQAQERLQATQERVEENLQHVQELREQASTLERTAGLAPSTSSSAVVVASAPQETPQPALSPADHRRRGLFSSLDLEPGLENFWYPAAFSAKLLPDTMVPIELFNETWVLFRDQDGKPACVRDECAHRACPLSLGRVVDGQIECPYHGWQYNGAGDCTKMPSTRYCKGVTVTSLPCSEVDGFVWIWPGEEAPSEVPQFAKPPEGFAVHAEIEVEVPVEHGLLMENLLDLAHAPFTHTTTFAKGWPVPEAVKFHATKLLTGNWDPYPITMAFQPPCMVLSTIGLAQPGKIERGLTAQQCANHLHQLHVCLPSRPGHTRLLYRMSLDFLGWLQYVPGIEKFWQYIAGQVLGEDLVLVKGQQERMLKGGDTWNFPVSYDKLAVRYRRWRNAVGAGEVEGAAAQAAQAMSAGQLFTVEEEELHEGHGGVQDRH